MKAWFNTCIENIKNIFRGSSVNPSTPSGFHELPIAPMNIRTVSTNEAVEASIPYEVTAVPSIFELAAASQLDPPSPLDLDAAPLSPVDLTTDSPSPLKLATDVQEPDVASTESSSPLPGSVPAAEVVEDMRISTPISEETKTVTETIEDT
jgi:hypothetical protein